MHRERRAPAALAAAGEPSADLAELAPIEIEPLEIVPLDPAETSGTWEKETARPRRTLFPLAVAVALLAVPGRARAQDAPKTETPKSEAPKAAMPYPMRLRRSSQ